MPMKTEQKMWLGNSKAITQMKYKVWRGSLSTKLINILIRTFIVLLIPRTSGHPSFLVLVHWLLSYCSFCENIKIYLFDWQQGFRSPGDGLKRWKYGYLLVLILDSTHIQWGSNRARSRTVFCALFISIYPMTCRAVPQDPWCCWTKLRPGWVIYNPLICNWYSATFYFTLCSSSKPQVRCFWCLFTHVYFEWWARHPLHNRPRGAENMHQQYFK